ncbi:MAG: ABC transporter ATP-binding protein, partial [Clostridia bacterium]|nr:ABC transporter ATP-binding protein [Clostridia bacterium]
MLETKDLIKIYKPKKGVPVTALDKVSLKFPEKGMVFLLGKSGSGKSTLLNVLGGLDKYDGGEIIIKGVSSKAFRQKHFDSYRNTYVGFIFQEYNVLDDFTVGANIALAIELQNRKANDSEINKILAEVDLEGYGNRKPNELSGGQKQRVAIARALVKNPQIIMADEPTGALDSNTGKQIFDTLKKLSKNKLVIVVSHDREFAESYADRIIELSDGRVISDVEYDENYTEKANDSLSFNGNIIEVPEAYQITEADRNAINDYIKSLNNKTSIKINSSSNNKFKKTDESKIGFNDSSPFKLIKSKLPLKNAFK